MKQQRYRRLQVSSVALGVMAAILSLLGGAFRNPLLAQLGAVGFLAALGVVIVLGVLAWRRYG